MDRSSVFCWHRYISSSDVCEANASFSTTLVPSKETNIMLKYVWDTLICQRECGFHKVVTGNWPQEVTLKIWTIAFSPFQCYLCISATLLYLLAYRKQLPYVDTHMANLTRKLNFPTKQVREKVSIKLADGFRTTFPLKIDPQDVTSQGIDGLQTATRYFLFRSIAFHTLTRVYPSFRIIFVLPSWKIESAIVASAVLKHGFICWLIDFLCDSILNTAPSWNILHFETLIPTFGIVFISVCVNIPVQRKMNPHIHENPWSHCLFSRKVNSAFDYFFSTMCCSVM